MFRAILSNEPPHSRPRGTWRILHVGDEVSATFACPGCGIVGTLDEHEIKGDGSVHPSVECPENCGFHDYIVLEGWHGRNGVEKSISQQQPQH